MAEHFLKNSGLGSETISVFVKMGVGCVMRPAVCSITAVLNDTLKQSNAWRIGGDAMAKDDRASFSSWHEPAWHSTLSKTASKAVGNNDEAYLGMYMQTMLSKAARQQCKFVKLYL